MIPLGARAIAILAGLALTRVALASPLDGVLETDAVDLEGRLEFLAVGRFDDDTPRQNPQGRIQARLGADLGWSLRLETALTGTAGGTPRDASGAGIYDYGHSLQDLSPSLEVDEAFVELLHGGADLRVGVQKYAWGRLDEWQPNDLVNPEKLVDPLLDDEADRRIGVPSLSLSFPLAEVARPRSIDDLRVTLVGVPLSVPFRIADDDERWHPPLVRVPEESIADGVRVRNEGDFREGSPPDRLFEDGAVAARLAGLAAGVDFGLYAYAGDDPQPAFEARGRGFVREDALAPGGLAARSEIEVFPTHDRIVSLGADAATSVGGATLRAEAAYVFGRLYPRALRDVLESPRIGAFEPPGPGREQEVPLELDPVNVERDGIEWGVNADALFGDTFVLAQMTQTTVLGNGADLLISDFETRFWLTVRRTLVDDLLEAELRGLYGMQGVYGVAHPSVTVMPLEAVEVRVGLLVIAGHEESIVGQYHENDQATLRVRVLF